MVTVLQADLNVKQIQYYFTAWTEHSWPCNCTACSMCYPIPNDSHVPQGLGTSNGI